eukprot:gene24748-10386_t
MFRCPPGHGDIYPSLLGSGMLDKLIDAGIKLTDCVSVCESAREGSGMLDKLIDAGIKYVVCERTGADKKGGHLCLRKSDGKFMLRESAMCPDEDKPSFEDISKHK